MSPVAAVKNSGVAEWVKWVLGILISALIVVNGWAFAYTIGIEHRVTKVETDQAAHLISAGNDKTAINARIDRTDAAQAQVLTTINAVAVDVARIRGYMERQKDATK
ncbi:hypothetical protein [Hymenobacter sp. YC55]|uniref:hypothetical protein n=1 Tax=Hymenobacter sp. YC55 TaxID=3034019 RepID=UPI0023F73AF8|nr:hypothetical protein [Hymenobacter sp. YC55]MDF7809916.1 hypothetical protein [Hymenobacter sp. YC55]